jgi:hypothetical protein
VAVSLRIRRFIESRQQILLEAGRPVDPPLLHVAAGAVFENPWLHDGYVEDLWPVMHDVGPSLARELTGRLVELAGGRDAVVGYGKAAVVGEACEIEHGSALVHSPYLANYLRGVVHGTSSVSFTEARRAPGATIAIPTHHITEGLRRDYYQAIDLHLNDAPHANEIVIILAAVTGPRPFPRGGDRATDPDVGIDAMLKEDGWA